jgi:hypothetical protein
MEGNRDASVAQRLQKADLLAFERDNAAEREIDQECRHQKKHRRERAAHVSEHIESMVEICVRDLISSPVGSLSAVMIDQRIQALDHLALRSISQQPEVDRGECAVEVVGAGESLFGHPDDGEAPLIGHPIAWTDGIDEFG